ncbi:hypothetical protein B5S33_g1883 [[Candida] boidinii]|nr:hypothetical protein B5S33_g1883 [[Candida] boidinii]GMF53685.1 unnamed protein product [[Candida] boidinii]
MIPVRTVNNILRKRISSFTRVGYRSVAVPSLFQSSQVGSCNNITQHVSKRYHSSGDNNDDNCGCGHDHGHDHNHGQLKIDKPMLMIALTCKKCETRSTHAFSKQAYERGTVLITCPGCKNRHLIADHLKIFSDSRVTIQDILAAKGESTSTNIDDLVFDDIPEKLKGLIGHHAKDAPEEYRKKADPETSPLIAEPKDDKKD